MDSEVVKARKRINARNYRKRHPDRIKQRNATNWSVNKTARKKKNKVWRQANKCDLTQKRKEYVEANAKLVSESKKNSSIKAKKAALVAYGGENPKCDCCDEQDFLSLCIDHIGGGGNAHRKSIGKLAGYAFYVWLKKNNYPSGFRVLCINCNESEAAFGYCPHSDVKGKRSSKMSVYFKKIKRLVFSQYGGNPPKCACCSTEFFEFLCLDHNGTDHRRNNQRGGYTTYRWAINNNFPPGFRILCFRCNFKTWAYGKCCAL